jgi:hypothetical protein
MVYDEFIALGHGLLSPPSKEVFRRRLAAPEPDASAIHGQLGAQVALLQSPILPAASLAYSLESKNPTDQKRQTKKTIPYLSPSHQNRV